MSDVMKSDFDVLWENARTKGYVVYSAYGSKWNAVERLAWLSVLTEQQQEDVVKWARMRFSPDTYVYWEFPEQPEPLNAAERIEQAYARLRQEEVDRLALRGDEDTPEYKRLKEEVKPRKVKKPKAPPPSPAVKLFRKEKAQAKKRGALVCPSYWTSSLTGVGPDAVSGRLSGKRPAHHRWLAEEKEWGTTPFFHEGRPR